MKRVKVGAAFSDYVYIGETSSHRSKKGGFESDKEVHIRNYFFPLLLIISGLVLFGRLLYLQVFNGDTYRLLSDTNRTRTQIIHAPRGIIFDRNEKPLVYNMPGFREVINKKTTFINQKEALPLLASGDKRLEIDSLRQYPQKEEMTHVVGYVGQISEDELKDPQFSGYSIGDVIGKMGIEQQYEQYLKGADGQKLIEVNAQGNTIRTLGVTDPIPGQNITLTLDSTIQKSVYEAMSDVSKGAVIVSRPNGEILAMVSKPSFDPNLFTMGQHYTPENNVYPNIESVLTDSSGQPLLNRAISGAYPPGSTFKLLTAATGLEEKKIDENYTIDDTGILKVGNFSFSNWYFSQYGKTDGQINVVTAIKRSNDIFFYKLAELLGVDEISAEAKKFGVGEKSGIDLAGEVSGLLPTKEWKQKTLGEQWYLGDDYHYGIGQGFLLTTPMQVNEWTQAIANGGTLYKPHVLLSQKPQVKNNNLLTEKNFTLIRQGMMEACDTGGVAWPLFNFSVKNPKLQIDGKNFLEDTTATTSGLTSDYRRVTLACKTGTAQHGTEETLPHAWITLFAPAYNPQIVITVLVESSGEGSNIAAPIAKKILEGYFSK